MKNKILASMQEEASEFLEDPKNKMRDWWDNGWNWWGDFKFDYPKTACSLQYGGLALLVVLVGHVVSSMANIVYFRYPFDDFGYPFNFSYPFNETFRHSINVTANLTINNATTMYADNVRSLLCTLIESEAAIVAIVISLTLIAIQFTASEYSPRVIDISLKNPDMWFLLLIYGVSMFYGLVLIKQVPHDYMIPFEDVSFAFWLGVFSYVALVPYLLNIIRLLNPTTIVRLVSKDIAKDKILKYIKDQEGHSKQSTEDRVNETSKTNGDTEGYKNVNLNPKKSKEEKKDNKNPIQPILDIIYRSISNYDLETVRKGLEEIVSHAEDVIDSYFFSWDDVPKKDIEKLLNFLRDDLNIDWATKNAKVSESKVSEYNDAKTIRIFKHENSVEIIVAEKKENTTLKINDEEKRHDLKVKMKDGKLNIYLYLEEKEQKISEYFCDPLKRIARLAASKDDAGSTIEVIKKLQDFGEYSAKAELNAATEQVAVTLGAVGKISVGKGKAFEDAVSEVAKSLEKVGKAAVGEGLEEATEKVVSSLRDIGKAAVGEGLEEATVQAAKSLEAVVTETVKKDLKVAIMEVASALEAIGETAANKGLDEVTKEVASSLGAVGKAAANKGLDKVTIQAAKSLEVIGKAAADKGLEEITEEVASSLGAVGKAAADKGLNEVTKEVASSLGAVGKAAADKGLEEITEEVASSLGAVGDAAADKGLKAASWEAIVSLGAVGDAAADKGLKAASWAIMSLETVGTTAAENELKDVTEIAASSLGVIGTNTAKNELKDATVSAALSLLDIGRIAVEKKFMYVTKQAAKSLLDIGATAVEKKRLEEATQQIATSLAELRSLDNENVKLAISDKLKGPNSASLQKFLRLTPNSNNRNSELK